MRNTKLAELEQTRVEELYDWLALDPDNIADDLECGRLWLGRGNDGIDYASYRYGRHTVVIRVFDGEVFDEEIMGSDWFDETFKEE